MPNLGPKTAIYHITDLTNLPGIIAAGGLKSDAQMAVGAPPTVIGYGHIKERRLSQISVPCCDGKFVGEFVPFYYCPRSPMLYTINRGNTGLAPGCQESVLHLVSSVEIAQALGKKWAISDGNGGSFAASFSTSPNALDDLDWEAIDTRSWSGKSHEKMAEFLVEEFFPWKCVQKIGCHNRAMADEVARLIAKGAHKPLVAVEPNWYY